MCLPRVQRARRLRKGKGYTSVDSSLKGLKGTGQAPKCGRQRGLGEAAGSWEGLTCMPQWEVGLIVSKVPALLEAWSSERQMGPAVLGEGPHMWTAGTAT